jgi:beta-lactamase class A
VTTPRASAGIRIASFAPLAALLALVVACTFWLGSAWGSSGLATPAASGTSTAASTVTPTATSPSVAPATASAVSVTTLTPVATTTSPTALAVSLADLGVSGSVSVAVYDLDDGDQLTAGSGSFETASIVKVDILVALLVQRNGSLTAAQKTLARSMITISDNSAATTLFQAVGSTAGLNRTNTALGLVETSAGTNGNWGLTRTTAADQIRLLKLVFQPNSVLSDTSRSYVSSLMTAVSEGQDWGVTAAATDADDSAVKNGWLQRTTTGLWDVTSIGRVVAKSHRLLVVVLVTSAKTMSGAVATIEKAATAAVNRVAAA